MKERRRVERIPILETFSLYVVVPALGHHRLKVHDLSELGIGFDMEPGEPDPSAVIDQGEILDIKFYLNQSLAIPLKAKVARITTRELRQLGCEFVEKTSKGYRALLAFLKMLDEISSAANLEKSSKS